MKHELIKKISNVLKSLKFRVFILVAIVMILPTLVSSIFILNVAVDNYEENKIENFRAGNTVIKNTIDNGTFFDETVPDETEQNTDNAVLQNNLRIEYLAKAYGCRIQLINKKSRIIYDSGSDVGKISVSRYVRLSMKGDEQQNRYDEGVEYAIPLIASENSGSSSGKTVIGVLYLNYSLRDVDAYYENVYRYVSITIILLLIFDLVAAWIISFLFTRPIKRIEKSIDEISVEKNLVDEEAEHDYPEVMEISRDFRKLVNRFKKQVQSQQEFVSNVSHELKTPITSMKILADSLIGQEGVPEELYQDFLQDISKEIDRENDIITDLLELVRIEKSQTEINISSVNINEILETVLKRLVPIAESKNIELIFESFRPVIADVDEVKFARVANNLVENAIKYNNTDGKVTVTLNSDYQYLYLNVADNGIGIAEEDQDRVFDRFFRVDKARARETGGSGLGLAITKEIVEKHHGSIKVHSKEEEGTTFTVRIPLKYIEQV